MATNPLLEKTSTCNLIKKNFVWHPYSQLDLDQQFECIVSANKASLYTADGCELIDAISSWWCILFGHNQEDIIKKMSTQLKQLDHVMLAGFTHPLASKLAEEIIKILPKGFAKVFYSDNGSTAVETAIKAALQYSHHSKDGVLRKKGIAFKEGYHGETFGCMAASNRDRSTKPFHNHLFEVDFIDPPQEGEEEKSVQQMEKLLNKEAYSFFIFEPLIQGKAGMKKHSIKGLDQLVKLCHDHDVVSIADEVMTGFGRTGPIFVSDILENTPSAVCLAKSLTGGIIPFAATVFSQKIVNSFENRDFFDSFLHGHTFCGNPLGCAASLATIELIQEPKWVKKRQQINQFHQNYLNEIKDHPATASAHVTGTILQIELKTNEHSSYFNKKRSEIIAFFSKHNLLIRPIGNYIYLIPPYCITEEQLNHIYKTISKFINLVK